MNQKGQVPYTKSLKVKVIAREPGYSYKNERNEERVLVNCAVADESAAVKCTVYDGSKFSRFHYPKEYNQESRCSCGHHKH